MDRNQILALASKLSLSRDADTRALAQWVLSQLGKGDSAPVVGAARALPSHVHFSGPAGHGVIRANGQGRR